MDELCAQVSNALLSSGLCGKFHMSFHNGMVLRLQCLVLPIVSQGWKGMESSRDRLIDLGGPPDHR